MNHPIHHQFFRIPERMYPRLWNVLLMASLFCWLAPLASSLPETDTVTYSFIHISDPQSLTTNYPETLDLTFSHIESMKNTYNISAIIITGDVVNTWNEQKDWDAFTHARDLTTIPVYEIAGNHDTDGGSRYEYYTAMTGMPKENYVTSLGDFDFAGINYAGETFSPEEFSRLRGLLAGSTRSHAIIATHYYMDEDGSLSPLGEDIDTYLIVRPSLVLMGHRHANFIRQRTVCGFPVIADMTNYQDGIPDGTTGWDYSAGTLYSITSVNGRVETITARIVHIYPVPYNEEERTVYGTGSAASRTPGSAPPAGLGNTASSVSSCMNGDLFCTLTEFFQQAWTDIRHVLS
jgi:hypothetical protein